MKLKNKNSQAREKLTRRLKRLTKMQLFCTSAEVSGEEVIDMQSFSPFHHLIVTSIKGWLPSKFSVGGDSVLPYHFRPLD